MKNRKNTNGKPLKRFKKNILRVFGFYRKYENVYLCKDGAKNEPLVLEYVEFKRLIWKGKNRKLFI